MDETIVKTQKSRNFLMTKFRRSRRDYICSDCGRIINEYEKYQLATGRHDGEWVKLTTCMECVEKETNQ